MKKITKLAAGTALCLVIAILSTAAVSALPALEIVGAPVLAILLGMVIGTLVKISDAVKPGISFTSKKVLQWAVILLGFGLNLGTVGRVGLSSLPIIVSTIATSLIVSYIVWKLLKSDTNVSILIGVGSSICGGSAIAATAPVIGADDDEIAQSISVVFLFNVLAALIYPTMGGWLGLTDTGFGLFAGTAINDTSSVTAAASVWDTLYNTGGTVLEHATIVKLTRTLAIIPITLVLALWRARHGQAEGENSGEKVSVAKMFPMFILYFVLASAITTVLYAVLEGEALAVAASVFAFLKKTSKFFIVMAMGAIGINTDIVKLIKTGGKPILLGFLCWVCIGLVSLAMQHLMGLW